MDVAKAKAAIRKAIKTQRAIFLWGAPGLGKSAICKQIADELQLPFVDVRMTTLNPVDLRGLPTAKDGEAKWLRPSFLPSGPAFILFDELNAAPPAVQAAAYQLVLDRRIGEFEIPAGSIVCAAGNREEDAGVTFQMPTPLANRFIHIEISPDVEVWRDWAVNHGIHESVIGFLSFRPSLLHAWKDGERSFPTPRTWEFVSDLVGADCTDLELIGGTVGHGASVEYNAFRALYSGGDVPDIDGLISGAVKRYTVRGSRQDVHYAVVAGIASRVVEMLKKNQKEGVKAYMNGLQACMTSETPREIVVRLVRDITQSHAVKDIVALNTNPVWSKFCKEYSVALTGAPAKT